MACPLPIPELLSLPLALCSLPVFSSFFRVLLPSFFHFPSPLFPAPSLQIPFLDPSLALCFPIGPILKQECGLMNKQCTFHGAPSWKGVSSL